MKLVERQTIKFLDNAMHGKKIKIDEIENINWAEIVEEAKAHKIESLVYSSIDWKSFSNIDKGLLDNWKKDTFLSGVGQLNHMRLISIVFKAFKDVGIPVMALKGLVVRDFYPRPDLRTMCDADILVNKDDLEKSSDLLLSLGYRLIQSSEMHHNFYKDGSHVELHWVITNERYHEGIPEIESEIWKNAVEVNILDSKVLSMSDEDLAVHLCLHMATHLINRGFGIRQICDLVLLVEQRGEFIGWDSFMRKISLCGIERFTISIFEICNRLFNMEVPKQLQVKNKAKIIDMLIADIFSNGVHGKRDSANAIAKEMAPSETKVNETSVAKKYFNTLFPRVNDMSETFDYAKKNKVLTPVAWVHHFGVWAFKDEYSVGDKLKFATSAMSVSKKRSELLKELNL